MPDRVKDRTFLGLFRDTILLRQIRQNRWPKCAPTVVFWADVAFHKPPPIEDGCFPRSVERRFPVYLGYLAELANHVAIRRKPQNRAVYRPLVLPTENVLVTEINWPYEIKIEVDPITQSLRLHGVAKKIRAERGQTNVKISRECWVRNHLVRVADFDTVRDATEFVRGIGIKPEWVADGHRRDHGQALNITELFADPQRIQSVEHASPQQTRLLSYWLCFLT